jgi:hypothetical protein
MSRRSKFQEKPSEYKIILCPVPEDSQDFQRRFNSVQNMTIRMIAIGRKKGRPTIKDLEYEIAA